MRVNRHSDSRLFIQHGSLENLVRIPGQKYHSWSAKAFEAKSAADCLHLSLKTTKRLSWFFSISIGCQSWLCCFVRTFGPYFYYCYHKPFENTDKKPDNWDPEPTQGSGSLHKGETNHNFERDLDKTKTTTRQNPPASRLNALRDLLAGCPPCTRQLGSYPGSPVGPSRATFPLTFAMQFWPPEQTWQSPR